ncbi:DNA-protecting protein DprA [Candidatus Saganbacteria bacterium]|nr:DNA-protecting protein DprA [Candidatus Saganbacteria bacterium]
MTNLKYWLAINNITNLGPVTINKLWEHFGDIKTVWEASKGDIQKIEGLSKPAVAAFLEKRDKIDLEEQPDLIRKNNVKVITIEEENYPANLKNIYAPPPVLYIKGSLFKADEKALAIVGTRRASSYGLEIAKRLAFELAGLGITIVSGLASGVDTAAHKGALEAKGRTLAIFGCGVDMIFPAENRELAKEIESSGACVSEFPMGARTEKGNFPRRNRIISGLTLGTIVVEGNYDSGAMITAKDALEQGREVFAVPGNVEADQSKGPHWLIKQGAKLVESVDDILSELEHILGPYKIRPRIKEKKDLSGLSGDEKRIVEALVSEPRHIDQLANSLKMEVQSVSSLLMMLELKNFIKPLPGKFYTVL